MLDREFISQVVIVLAVCAGAWMMLVQPKTAEIARLEHQLAESSQTSSLSSQDGIEALAGKFATFGRQLETIRRRNAVAEDASSLYATVMRLASESQVRVQAMQPTPARETASGKAEAVKVAKLEMTLSGSFENIARFVDRVTQIDAFIRPSGLQLIPIDNPSERAVSARFSCDVLAFDIDAKLAGVGEQADAQQ